jgi:hypothetical protein
MANWLRVGYCQGNFKSDNCAEARRPLGQTPDVSATRLHLSQDSLASTFRALGPPNDYPRAHRATGADTYGPIPSLREPRASVFLRRIACNEASRHQALRFALWASLLRPHENLSILVWPSDRFCKTSTAPASSVDLSSSLPSIPEASLSSNAAPTTSVDRIRL